MRGFKLALLCAIALFSFDVNANDDFMPVQDDPDFLVDAGEGATLRFAGEREEGALEFFVKKDAPDYPQSLSMNASELNAITPAAGVQFRLKF